MNVYQDDPQLALTTLEKIAEEIPSGVSAAEVGQIINHLGPCPKEVTDNLKDTIIEELKKDLHLFWEVQNINQKLQQFKNMDQQTTDVGACLWRQDLSNVIIKKNLNAMKEALILKIKKVEEENQSLEKCLKSKIKMVQKQKTSVKSQNFLF